MCVGTGFENDSAKQPSSGNHNPIGKFPHQSHA